MNSQSNYDNACIIMTDLANSTGYKKKYGHRKGVDRMFAANKLTDKIFNDYGSRTLKNLGDGLLIVNKDPIKSCLAAIELLTAINSTEYGKYEIQLKMSITYGSVEVNADGLSNDIFGTPVDKCARIQSNTKPNQILIEESIYNICGTQFIDNGITVSQPEKVKLKNFEDIVLREIGDKSTQHIGIKSFSFPPFIKELRCDTCKEVIGREEIKTMGAVIAFLEDIDPKSGITTTQDLYVCHKGRCDKYIAAWRDVTEFIYPEGYLDLLLTMMKNIQCGDYVLTNKAIGKLFDIAYALYPYVFRASSREEFDDFLTTQFLLKQGL